MSANAQRDRRPAEYMCLKCAARGSLEMQDPKNRQKCAIWTPSHNFVGRYLRNSGMYRQSEKAC